MLKDWELLAKSLDTIRPRWALEWASQTDLRDLAVGYIDEARLRQRVAQLFHPILSAALQAGLIAQVKS